MAARSLPTVPSFPGNSELTSTQLNQLVTYMQFWSSPPCFRIEQHTSQTIASTTVTQITCDTTIHDSDSGVVLTSPYSYVIPYAGVWDFDGMVGIAGSTTGFRAPAVYQNGTVADASQPVYPSSSNTGGFPVVCHGLLCNVGDVISLWMDQSSGGNLATAVNTGQMSYLAGRLVSLQNP